MFKPSSRDKLFIHGTKKLKRYIFTSLKKRNKILILFTEGRGGGTWLMELMQQNLNAITLFEPIQGDLEKDVDRYFSNLPREEILQAKSCQKTRPVHEYLTTIFNGKVYEDNTIMFNRVSTIFKSKITVIKFVNKTLIAPYILANFHFHYRPLCLIRNPIDIVNSRTNYGYKAYISECSLSKDELDSFFRKNIYSPYNFISHRIKTNYEKFVFELCVNIDILKFLGEKVNVIGYEKLKTKDPATLEILKSEYGVANFKGLSKPSKSAERVLVTKKKDSNFTKNQIARFQCIIDEMGIEQYATTPGR